MAAAFCSFSPGKFMELVNRGFIFIKIPALWRDRHKTVRVYVRRGKGPRVPLPADVASDEFREAVPKPKCIDGSPARNGGSLRGIHVAPRFVLCVGLGRQRLEPQPHRPGRDANQPLRALLRLWSSVGDSNPCFRLGGRTPVAPATSHSRTVHISRRSNLTCNLSRGPPAIV
ncbi:MAG: hypothetical protein K0Q60_4705 [Microvirga sp.]|nr:hypothetical protein [Microvirga sp.]